MLTGGLLALLAAVTFAINNAAFRRGALTGSVAQAMAISLSVGSVVYVLSVVLTGSWGALWSFSSESVALLCTAGIVHFGWGRYCLFRATKAMGANLVGPPQQSSIIVTLALAIVVLGEELTPLRILGILLLLLGPTASLRARTPKPEPGVKPVGFQPKYAEGYTFAFLSALGYGAGPILVSAAIRNSDLASSLAGGLIAYAAVSVATALMLFSPKLRAEIRAVNPLSSKWFAVSGVLVALSQMCGYTALAFAPVSVVTPIQRLSVVFRVFVNSMVNREHEVLGGRVWIATGIAMIGVLFLTIDTEFALAWLRLPAPVEQFLRWEWRWA